MDPGVGGQSRCLRDSYSGTCVVESEIENGRMNVCRSEEDR